MKKQKINPVLTVVMDGLGINNSEYGNAVKVAHTPHLDRLFAGNSFRTLKAHGTAVGLASDNDMGNSEVGHNTLGAGRIFDQGSKLVENAIRSGDIFKGECWLDLISYVKKTNATLHLLGLLSDGNVHSHQDHLYAICNEAINSGVGKIRIHTLLDGRDVGERSAEVYVDRLEKYLYQVRASGIDIAVASGGGRMVTTMDRYEADWRIVSRGWLAHVHGCAEHNFPSISAALEHFRRDANLTDQNIPPFVIEDVSGPVGKIGNGDGVVLFNFRGDRAIQISQAFTNESFSSFDRGKNPQVFFAGMMEYDGDAHIPPRYLVTPPHIDRTLGERLASEKLRQFACSETQKFGHVTYFWNGNRSGKFGSLEDYVEVESDNIDFSLKPWMKAHEITEKTIARINEQGFDCGRINFANPDMVGHTGSLEAAALAVGVVDQMVSRLLKAAAKAGVTVLLTADHGNCDEMFEKESTLSQDWLSSLENRPRPKTSHTLNPVPFVLFDPLKRGFSVSDMSDGGLANIANTILTLMGLPPSNDYLPSLVKRG